MIFQWDQNTLNGIKSQKYLSDSVIRYVLQKSDKLNVVTCEVARGSHGKMITVAEYSESRGTWLPTAHRIPGTKKTERIFKICRQVSVRGSRIDSPPASLLVSGSILKETWKSRASRSFPNGRSFFLLSVHSAVLTSAKVRGTGVCLKYLFFSMLFNHSRSIGGEERRPAALCRWTDNPVHLNDL